MKAVPEHGSLKGWELPQIIVGFTHWGSSMVASVLLLATLTAPDKVDDIVAKAMKEQKIPGVAVMVLKNGKPIKTKGYGHANVEHKVPVKPETVFQSGSIGKMFTATLIMMLVEEGKLKLDEPIGKHFPEASGAWDAITLRHFLSHTSGLANLPYQEIDRQKEYTDEDFLKMMLAQKPIAKPGEGWAYNNGCYILLGALVKRVTGKFYGDLLQERVFKPLDMISARVVSDSAIVPNRAAGYVINEGGFQNQDWVSSYINSTADGELYLSLRDFAQWDAALHSSKLLKKSSWDLMWTPNKLTDGRAALYGFGWFTWNIDGKRLTEHSGSSDGFTSYFGRHLDEGISVVVLANLDGWSAKTEALGRDILKVYVP